MSCESFAVVGFDHGPLLQGQTRIANLKVVITRLLLVLEVCNVKPTYKKSWAANLLMWSDLTLGPCFKVKQGDKLKSANNSLIIGPRGLQCETKL